MPAARRRRVPELRREELAELIGVSATDAHGRILQLEGTQAARNTAARSVIADRRPLQLMASEHFGQASVIRSALEIEEELAAQSNSTPFKFRPFSKS